MLNVTLFGEGSSRTETPLDGPGLADLSYVTGHVIGQIRSAVDGIILDELFFGNIFLEDKVFFVDSIQTANQTFSSFNDPFEGESGQAAAAAAAKQEQQGT